MATMVTIRGTWSRTNTAREEVYYMRRGIRRAMRNLGGSLEYTLPHDQKDPPVGADGRYPNSGVKSGTFIADVPLVDNYNGYRRNGEAALHVVQAVLARHVCRPPKLKLDREATTTRRDTVAGIL